MRVEDARSEIEWGADSIASHWKKQGETGEIDRVLILPWNLTFDKSEIPLMCYRIHRPRYSLHKRKDIIYEIMPAFLHNDDALI